MSGRTGYQPHLHQQEQHQPPHSQTHHPQTHPHPSYHHPHFQQQHQLPHPSYQQQSAPTAPDSALSSGGSGAIAIQAQSSPSRSGSATSPQSISAGASNKNSRAGTKSKRPRPYASKTCSECRRRKIACVASDPDPEVCKRCYKMKLHCTLSEENARGDGRRRKRRSGIGQKKTKADINGGADDEDGDEDDRVDDGYGGMEGEGNDTVKAPRSVSDRQPYDQSGEDSEVGDEGDGQSDGRTSPLYGQAAGGLHNPSALSRRPSAAVDGRPSHGSHGSHYQAALPPPPPLPAHLGPGHVEDNQPDTDFLYSMRDDRSRALPPLSSRDTKKTSSRVGGSTTTTGEQNLSGGSGRMIIGSATTSRAAERAAAQNVMLVHGCPIWVYSDLMARFNLLNISDHRGRAGGIVARLDAAELSWKLTSLPDNVIDTLDNILEDARLIMPHIPLLSNLILQQEERYDSARTLLIAILVYVASNEGELPATQNPLLPFSVLSELKSFLNNQALDSIMFSPMKSREIVIAAEILAVYDPLLGHPAAGKLETSRFLLPTSFYLDLAIGFAYRIGVGDSVHELQQWYLDDLSKASKSSNNETVNEKPLPDHIVSALHDATIWASLELHISELNRNLQGATNCFAKDWKPLWPHQATPTSSRRSNLSPKALPSFSTILQHCSKRLPSRRIGGTAGKGPASIRKGFSVASRLGMVNLAFRHDGLTLMQDILSNLYHGIPDVEKIDRCYKQLENDLTGKLRSFADKSFTQVLASSKSDPPSPDLLDLSNDIFEREIAWVRHFYGGYCFAILLWLPNLQKGGRAGPSARGSGGKGDKEDGSRDLHEHGIHDVDMAASVINTIKNQQSDPDHIKMMNSVENAADNTQSPTQKNGALSISANGGTETSDAARSSGDVPSASTTSSMSTFHFLVKHNETHERILQQWMTLSLDILSRLRCSNIHRISTNSRIVYVSKEIIENHATRRRGWGKVGENAAIHIGLLSRACEQYKQKGNALDNSLAKLTKILEKILDGWRRVEANEQTAQNAPPKKQSVEGASASTSQDQRRVATPASKGNVQSTMSVSSSYRKTASNNPAISAIRTHQQNPAATSSPSPALTSGGTHVSQSHPDTPSSKPQPGQPLPSRYPTSYHHSSTSYPSYTGLHPPTPSASSYVGSSLPSSHSQHGSASVMASSPYQGSYGGAGPADYGSVGPPIMSSYGSAGFSGSGGDPYGSGSGGGSYYNQPYPGPGGGHHHRASLSSTMGVPTSASASSSPASHYSRDGLGGVGSGGGGGGGGHGYPHSHAAGSAAAAAAQGQSHSPRALPSPSLNGGHGLLSSAGANGNSPLSSSHLPGSVVGQHHHMSQAPGLNVTHPSFVQMHSPSGGTGSTSIGIGSNYNNNNNNNGGGFINGSMAGDANLNLLDLDIFTDAPLDLNVENLFFDNWPQMDLGVDMSSLFQKQ